MKKWILLLALLITVRAVLPQIILKRLNHYLANFSPTHYIHMQDLDLSILRMLYEFQQIEMRFKNSAKNYLEIREVKVSLAWREILKGRVLMDAVVDGAHIFLSDKSMQTAKKDPNQTKDDARNVSKKLFPVKIERLMIRQSSFQYVANNRTLKVDPLEGELTNIIPLDRTTGGLQSVSQFKLKGIFPPSEATMSMDGNARFFKDPIDWSAKLIVKNFDLPSANGILFNIPFSFQSGRLDLFAEVKRENGNLKGYLKPFLNDVDIVGNEKDFKSGKHFFYEILSAVGNFVFKDSDTNTLASKIYFYKSRNDKEIQIDKDGAISSAYQHGFKKPLRPKLSEEIHLK